MSDTERRSGRGHRTVRTIALAAALGITSITLSQCRIVQDNVTGVDFTTGRLSGKSACIHQCNDQFKAAQLAEDQRFKDAIRACGGGVDCKKAERAKHDAIKDEIEQTKKDCKKNCYNEGGGAGGNQ